MIKKQINGEYIENFAIMLCHICEKSLGLYCLTDRYEGITAVCSSCYDKEIQNQPIVKEEA